MVKNSQIAPSGKKGGRPKGSKTRPDAPSKLKLLARRREAASQKPMETKPQPLPATPHETSETKTAPDTELFGAIKPAQDTPVDAGSESVLPDNPIIPEPGQSEQGTPANSSGLGNGASESFGGTETDTGKAQDVKQDDVESQKNFAQIVVDMSLNLLSSVIGRFWNPRPVGNEDGQCPYDERERLVTSCARWFASMALAVLTPGQAFAMECANYSMPRLAATFDWFRFKFMKKAKPGPATAPDFKDTRMPGSETPPVKPTEEKDPADVHVSGIDG